MSSLRNIKRPSSQPTSHCPFVHLSSLSFLLRSPLWTPDFPPSQVFHASSLIGHLFSPPASSSKIFLTLVSGNLKICWKTSLSSKNFSGHQSPDITKCPLSFIYANFTCWVGLILVFLGFLRVSPYIFLITFK